MKGIASKKIAAPEKIKGGHNGGEYVGSGDDGLEVTWEAETPANASGGGTISNL